MLEPHFLRVAWLGPLCVDELFYAYLSSYPYPCYIPWSTQVHIVLVGITFVGVLYHGVVITDLGAAMEPGVPYVLQPHGGATRCARCRGICYHDAS